MSELPSNVMWKGGAALTANFGSVHDEMEHKEIHLRTNTALRSLWQDTLPEDWPAGIPRLWPLQYPELRPGGLVFVGLNPSCPRKADDLVITDPNQLDDLRRAQELTQREARALGRVENDKMYRYFTHFPRLTPEGFHWEHVDMFAVRDRNQRRVKIALGLPDKWISFAERQFDIFLDLIRGLDPVAMVAVNALASELFLKRIPEITYLQDRGHHVFPLNGRSIPVLLSGMLTGQRALDRYSRCRLKWHIRQVLQTNTGQ